MKKRSSTKTLNPKSLFTFGGIAALSQLLVILVFSIVSGVLGEKPTTAAAYFAIYETNPIQAFLRGDFLIMILIALYLGTIPAFVMALWKQNPVWIGFTALFSLITVLGAIFTESSFSLLHLGVRYINASSETARAGLIAAGEALIASDLWNSTAAYLGGIFLQGSGVVLSIIMLRSKHFHKVTAISGLLGNAFDLVQHILHPFAPSIASAIQMFMGVFYFVWFPMLTWDFFKLAKTQNLKRI
jgi:hypothetical protein